MSGVGIERYEHLAVLRLAKPRGNAIDEPLVEELARAAEEVAADDTLRGAMLASGHPKLFCPGLDLVALAPYDRASMRRFMVAFATAMWALYGLPKPVVAAVGGSAVAGGCLLALTADHRVLKRGVSIGLNEVKVGVPLPWSATRLLRATVHAPALSRVALLGRNFTDAEAVELGLADEVAEDEGFEATCLARLAEYADKDPHAFATTKAFLREATLAEMMAQESERMGAFLDGWFSAGTQERLRAMAASLQSKA
jgi:enoyl-CoA hydratase/carnithine racemase